MGRLDVLVNGAGVNRRKPIVEVTVDDFDAITAVNMPVVYLLKQAAPHPRIPHGRSSSFLAQRVQLSRSCRDKAAVAGDAQHLPAVAIDEFACYRAGTWCRPSSQPAGEHRAGGSPTFYADGRLAGSRWWSGRLLATPIGYVMMTIVVEVDPFGDDWNSPTHFDMFTKVDPSIRLGARH